jgi:L-aspartate semialdehyde sulfurtransferase ferredoxin
MKAVAKRKSLPAATRSGAPRKTRLWLMFPPAKIKNPVIWELGQKFKVITNIRQASITDELGIVCLELEGPSAEVAASIRWLEKGGINVEPVEINVLES